MRTDGRQGGSLDGGGGEGALITAACGDVPWVYRSGARKWTKDLT